VTTIVLLAQTAADNTPYGVLLAALGLVGTVVGVAMKLTSGSQTRGDNAFAAHLQTLVQDRDRALESSKRAEARAQTAEQEALECRRAQQTQAQEMFDLRLRVATLETTMKAAGLSP
jgi:hypothetical protein